MITTIDGLSGLEEQQAVNSLMTCEMKDCGRRVSAQGIVAAQSLKKTLCDHCLEALSEHRK